MTIRFRIFFCILFLGLTPLAFTQGLTTQAAPSYRCLRLYQRVIAETHAKRDLKSISTLRVGTLNLTDLHFNMKGDGIKEAKSDEQMQVLGRTVLESKADVIVLQEVIEPDALLRFTSENLNNSYDVLFSNTNDPAGRAIAFLVKKDLPLRVDLFSHKNLKWQSKFASKPEPVFSRDLPFVELRTLNQKPESTPLLTIFGTHYSMIIKDNLARVEQRGEQIRTTAKIISEYEQSYDRPPFLMLAGDFNANVSNPQTLADIRNVGMQDTAALLNISIRDQISHILGKKLDGIFVNSTFVNPSSNEQNLVTRSKVHNYVATDGSQLTVDSPSAKLPSTHFLVTADVKLSPLVKATLDPKPAKHPIASAQGSPHKDLAPVNPHTDAANQLNAFVENTYFQEEVLRLPDTNSTKATSEGRQQESELAKLIEPFRENPEFLSALDVDALKLVLDSNAKIDKSKKSTQDATPTQKYIDNLDLPDRDKIALKSLEIPDLVLEDLKQLSEKYRERVYVQSFLKIALNPNGSLWKNWNTNSILGSERLNINGTEYRVLFQRNNQKIKIVFVGPEKDMDLLQSRLNDLQ